MQHHEISAQSLPLHRLKKTQGHKFSHGHAFVVSGGAGQTGAARLAARGALRIGAGLVTIGVPASAVAEVASQVTAVMLKETNESANLEEHLRDERINALCIGPGLGLTQLASDFVACVLSSRRQVVLDADALSIIAKDRGLFSALHEGCVLTPHEGEFARLFPDLSERLAATPPLEKAAAAALAAERAGCVVLLKGADTVVARPDGQIGVHSATGKREAPWLATAGAGDVLAGIITGLLARGFSTALAAEIGSYVHVEAALSFGPGLIAEDLPEQIPTVLRNLFA